MSLLATLLLMLLSACAETRLYESGQLVAVIQGDCTNVTVKTFRGSEFHADTLNHSDATKAWGTASSQVVGAAGAGATSVAAMIR